MTKIDKEEARQGREGKPVVYVLIASLVLAVIVAFAFQYSYEPEEVVTLEDRPVEEAPTGVE